MSSLTMEMERLDMEINKTRKKFYSGVLGKKRQVKRTWLEINALTNAHLLQMLPYRAMLGHVAKLAEERDKVIEEIIASQAKSSSSEIESNSHCKTDNDIESEISPTEESLPEENGVLERKNSTARDEAVQTEESSFSTLTTG